MADHFFISKSQLSAVLKNHCNQSFLEIIRAHKLNMAALLLKNTDFSIKEIDMQVGYENTTFFYKIFKEKFHCSPSEYRKAKNV